MSLYPQGVATGNVVIAAALAYDAAITNFHHSDSRFVTAFLAFRKAVAAHRATIATPQINGPDIDTDHPDPDRNQP